MEARGIEEAKESQEAEEAEELKPTTWGRPASVQKLSIRKWEVVCFVGDVEESKNLSVARGRKALFAQ